MRPMITRTAGSSRAQMRHLALHFSQERAGSVGLSGATVAPSGSHIQHAITVRVERRAFPMKNWSARYHFHVHGEWGLGAQFLPSRFG
jgi:hypothetical protein